jgi:F-type H+-transporting ATPase subunit epsilon
MHSRSRGIDENKDCENFMHVDILTPEKVVVQKEADSVVVPAADGELGILKDHAPLIAELQPGQIRLTQSGSTETFAVSGGFVQVLDNKISVFAETAEMAQEIDVERAKQAAERARAALRGSRDEEDLAKAEAALMRALARLRVVESIRHVSSRRGINP